MGMGIGKNMGYGTMTVGGGSRELGAAGGRARGGGLGRPIGGTGPVGGVGAGGAATE